MHSYVSQVALRPVRADDDDPPAAGVAGPLVPVEDATLTDLDGIRPLPVPAQDVNKFPRPAVPRKAFAACLQNLH